MKFECIYDFEQVLSFDIKGQEGTKTLLCIVKGVRFLPQLPPKYLVVVKTPGLWKGSTWEIPEPKLGLPSALDVAVCLLGRADRKRVPNPTAAKGRRAGGLAREIIRQD